MTDLADTIADHLRSVADEATPLPALDEIVGDAVPLRRSADPGRRPVRWFAAAAVVVALAGTAVVVVAVRSGGGAPDRISPAAQPNDDTADIEPPGSAPYAPEARIDDARWELVTSDTRSTFSSAVFRNDAGQEIHINIAPGRPDRLRRDVDGVAASAIERIDADEQIAHFEPDGDERGGLHYLGPVPDDDEMAGWDGADIWIVEVDGFDLDDRDEFLALVRSMRIIQRAG